MKKCVLMFVLLILAIVMAILTDNQMEVAPSNNYIADAPQTHTLLATTQSND